MKNNIRELRRAKGLRQEDLAGYRENLKAMLDNIIVQEKDGTRHPLRKKPTAE